LPSLLSTLPRSAQVQIAVLGPLLLGALSGFLLDTSAVGYWAVQVAGTAGGVSGGMEHSGPAAGARRGLVAGALFGAGLMGAHAISDQRALTYVPHPLALIMLASAAIGAALSGVGGVVRLRWEKSQIRLSDTEFAAITKALAD
jgi:hypothetical protein